MVALTLREQVLDRAVKSVLPGGGFLKDAALFVEWNRELMADAYWWRIRAEFARLWTEEFGKMGLVWNGERGRWERIPPPFVRAITYEENLGRPLKPLAADFRVTEYVGRTRAMGAIPLTHIHRDGVTGELTRELKWAETRDAVLRPLVDKTFEIMRKRGLIPEEPIELLIARGKDPYAMRSVEELLS
jgi:hypothetical protein